MKVIKYKSDVLAYPFFLSSFNCLVSKSTFRLMLKQAKITPVFKESDRNLKGNYRPVSFLQNLSEIFER